MKQDKKVKAIFDTGAFFSLFIEEDIVKYYRIPMDGLIFQSEDGVELPSAGDVQLVVKNVGRNDETIKFKNCYIDLNRLNAVDDKDVKILVGPNILKYYFTIIDLKQNVIVLAPYENKFDNIIDPANSKIVSPDNPEITSLFVKLKNNYQKFELECNFSDIWRVLLKLNIPDSRFVENSFWAHLDTGSKRTCINRRFMGEKYFKPLKRIGKTRLFPKDNRQMVVEKISCGDFVSSEKELLIYDIGDKKRDYNAIVGWSFFKDSLLVLDHNKNQCFVFR